MSAVRIAGSRPDVDGPITWTWPFSLLDVQTIDALPHELRAVVERYVRQARVVQDADADEIEYNRGWEDAMESARDEVDGLYFAPPPSADRRKRRRG